MHGCDPYIGVMWFAKISWKHLPLDQRRPGMWSVASSQHWRGYKSLIQLQGLLYPVNNLGGVWSLREPFFCTEFRIYTGSLLSKQLGDGLNYGFIWKDDTLYKQAQHFFSPIIWVASWLMPLSCHQIIMHCASSTCYDSNKWWFRCNCIIGQPITLLFCFRKF